MKKVIVIIVIIFVFLCAFLFGKNLVEKIYENSIIDNEETVLNEIKNPNIKERGELSTSGLWSLDGVTSSGDIDLQMTDMTWNNECRLYHKIITNINDYNKFSDRIGIPEMIETDFDDVFMVIVSNENIRAEAETDLLIYDVYADDSTTHIILKQKDNPNVYAETNVFYAIVDNSQLRDNVEVVIE